MSPTAALDPETEYKRTVSCDNGLGFRYETKMTALAALRLYRDYDEFNLANNFDKGGKFDDIVFNCTSNGFTETWFIQLKHKQVATLETRKISLSALRTKDEFNLTKYFQSYQEVVRKFRPGSKDAVFGNDPRSTKFVLFTNALLHPLMLKGPTIQKKEVFLSSKSATEANYMFKKEDLWEVFAGMKLNNTELDGFLDRFYFCTGQANEEDMDLLIQEEIEVACKDLNKTDAKYVTYQLCEFIYSWLKKGEYLTKDKVKAILSRTAIETQFSRKNECTLQFVPTFVKFVLSSASSANLLSLMSKADSTDMCMTLLKQEGLLSEPNKVLPLQKLNHENIRDHLLAEWMSKTNNSMTLVIDCEGDIMAVNKKTVGVFLGQLAACNRSNKIILVYTIANAIAVDIANTAKSRNIRFNCTMANLTPESQTMLRERKVNFQGYETSLESLMPNTKRLDDVFDLALMTQLIQGRVVKVGLKPVSNIPYYVTRVLNRHSTTLPFFLNVEKGQFALSGISYEHAIMQFSSLNVTFLSNEQESKCILHKIIIMEENSDEEFSVIAQKTKGDLHWFELKRGPKKMWQWKKSKNNSDMSLISDQVTSDLDYLSTENIMDIKDKVVVITAEPGMGKSTLLNHLAEETKKKCPHMWVICLALNDFTDQFYKPDFIQKIDENARNLISLAAGVDSVTSKFDLRLFNQCYDITGDMIVLLDGFDEITPTFTEQGKALIHSLKRSQVARIWVTARTQWRTLLEDNTSSLSYTIKAFTSKDQSSFLSKFWKNEIPNVDELQLKECVEKILELIEKCFDAKLHQFTGIPLQTRMVAEVFLDSVRSYHATGNLQLKDRLNGLELFQEFVAKKRGIQQEKAKVTVTNASAIWEQKKLNEQREKELMRLSLLALLHGEVCRTLDPPVTKEMKKELKEMIVEGNEKSGIVLSFQGDQPQFIHRTFAEYFAALFFTKHIATNKSFLESTEFNEGSFSFVRYFFDRILCQGHKLHEAVLEGQAEDIPEILKNVDVNSKDAGGRTALHIAAAVPDSEDTIQLLLQNGADAELLDGVLGWRPIEFACKIKATENIAPLLEKAPRPVDKGSIPVTWETLQKTVSGDYLQLFLCLLENGIHEVESLDDLSAQTWFDQNVREGLTLLHLAAAFNACQILEYLLRKKSRDSQVRLIECVDGLGNTPLVLAGTRGCTNAIRTLVEAGANTLAQSKDGKNLIQFAVELQNLDILGICLTDAKKRNAAAQEFLPMAVTTLVGEKSPEKVEWAAKILQLLFSLYPELVELKTPKGLPLMTIAISRGNTLAVQCLDSMGADVNVMIADKPALHYAARHGNEGMVKTLLKCKTLDINARDSDGYTALDNALLNGHAEVFELLLGAGATMGTSQGTASLLHRAITKGDIEMLTTLLHCEQLDVNGLDEEGHTPLYRAILLGQADTIEALIDAGGSLGNDVNVVTPEGPLLHVAARYGQENIFMSLLASPKLEINARDEMGYTALHKAIAGGQVEVFQLLVDAGADIHCTSNDGSTLTHAVAATANPAFFFFLLESGLSFDKANDAGQTGLSLLKEAGAVELVKVLDPTAAENFPHRQETTEKSVASLLETPANPESKKSRKKKPKNANDAAQPQAPVVPKKPKKAKQPPPPPKKKIPTVPLNQPAQPAGLDISSVLNALRDLKTDQGVTALSANALDKLKKDFAEIAISRLPDDQLTPKLKAKKKNAANANVQGGQVPLTRKQRRALEMNANPQPQLMQNTPLNMNNHNAGVQNHGKKNLAGHQPPAFQQKQPFHGPIQQKQPFHGPIQRKQPPQGHIQQNYPPQGQMHQNTPFHGPIQQNHLTQGQIHQTVQQKQLFQGPLQQNHPPQGPFQQSHPSLGIIHPKTPHQKKHPPAGPLQQKQPSPGPGHNSDAQNKGPSQKPPKQKDPQVQGQAKTPKPKAKKGPNIVSEASG